MATALSALCSDFYVNQKLALKMDLPSGRETVLHLFDRVRQELPEMDRFRRYDGELALESTETESQYSWMAMQQTSIRTGCVNPDALDQAYRLHRLILDLAPYFLSISPLDVESLELVFGFDLEAETNRNEAVFDALLADSPLAAVVDTETESLLDAQPFVGFSLDPQCRLQAYVEIKTRGRAREVARQRYERQPISVYLTVRRAGPMRTMEEISTAFGTLAGYAERLAEDRVIPHVVMPIHQMLLSRPGC